ncbi:MAG: hypothetical protein WC225_03930 [Acholeplasmataceae bacterium]|nr:hypothetical protein [Acholeplasmataceae bacterium]
MKTFIDRLFKDFQKYKNLTKRINEYTTVSTVTRSILGAMFIALIIIAIPVIIVINMFIYTKLTFVLSIILVLLVMTWVQLYFYFYYVLLKNYHEEIRAINTRIPQYVEFAFVNIFIVMIAIIVFVIIF